MKRYKNLKEDVVEEILNQLGGYKFIVMTGAKNLVKNKTKEGEQLSFRLPKAKDGINHVAITYLRGHDLYNVKFGRIRGVEYKIIHEVDNVYNDQLVDIFERTTGLYTHL
jgi:hypothetical protein